MAASPPHFEKAHEEEEEELEKDKDWLELGLGFSIACSKEDPEEEEEEHQRKEVSASPPPQLKQAKQKPTGLELGLTLATDHHQLDHDDHDDHGNYDHHCDEDYDDMNSGGGGLDDWQMPVPNAASHDYCTRTRPHAGLWFTLESYTNRNGEALPQIPKAYIRVKDENVTIFMVKKYLVRKLGLSNEAEVDISCMGQKLLHTLTLKQVRDCVWLPGLVESVNPTTLSFENYSHQSCINDHLMSLQYGRRCALN